MLYFVVLFISDVLGYMYMFSYGICASCESLIAAFGILFESIKKTIKAHILFELTGMFFLQIINKRPYEQSLESSP